MNETAAVIFAVMVDRLVGDPRLIPHPVVGMGKLISWSERCLRRFGSGAGKERMLGVLLVIVVLAAVLSCTLAVIWLAGLVHPLAQTLVTIWLISTTIAAKGLGEAAIQVWNPLVHGDLETARTRVGYIVGRDTDSLTEHEVARAAVETVAENIVDAVVSPIFYALIGGAPLALLYRAVNTLDSMVGYKNEKYRYFGWASARLDDVFNYIPARITGLLLCAAAFLSNKLHAGRAWRAIREDAAKHPSPNSGIPEAAVAGALGIQLGGRNYYGGIPSERARMGKPLRNVEPDDIPLAIRMLTGCVWLILLILLAAESINMGWI